MSRLDYGNALLAGHPLEHLKKLQQIQNIAARIITFTPRRDHITPIIWQLHWLPIKRRIEFKILLHVFRCINGTAPLYLADMLKRQCSTGRTRSSKKHLLEVPRTKFVSFGDRSFKVVGPRLWNALPIAIKAPVTPGLRPGYDLPATEKCWNRGQIVERTYDWSQTSWVIARAKSVAARSYVMLKPVTPGLRPGNDIAATKTIWNCRQIVERTYDWSQGAHQSQQGRWSCSKLVTCDSIGSVLSRLIVRSVARCYD